MASAQKQLWEVPDVGEVDIYLTTCKRTYQLRECLPQNVLMTWPYRSRVTWVVLDLNSGPEAIEVGDFMEEHFFVPVVTGHLQYLRCPQEYWHASWAKNSSHSAGSALHHAAQSGGVAPAPLVLVNCDNDNLLTTQFINTLVEHAPNLTAPVGSAHFLAMLRFNGRDGGVTGRIALSASVFRQLGGYDQSFSPMGYQDVDLARRAAALGTVKLVSGADLSGESVPNLP